MRTARACRASLPVMDKMPTIDDRPHLTIVELAERERVPIETVYGWNKNGTGPPRMKIGRYVRYRLADVLAWEASRLRGGGF